MSCLMPSYYALLFHWQPVVDNDIARPIDDGAETLEPIARECPRAFDDHVQHIQQFKRISRVPLPAQALGFEKYPLFHDASSFPAKPDHSASGLDSLRYFLGVNFFARFLESK